MIKDSTELLNTDGIGQSSYALGFPQRKRQHRVAEEQSRVSVALVNSMAQRKEPTLFDALETDTKLQRMKDIDERLQIERNGKPTYLTHRQSKVVIALGSMLSKYEEEEEFKTYVDKVNRKEKTNLRYSFPVSITELTKLVSSDGKARKRQKEDTIDDLRALSEIVQVQTYQYTDKAGDLVRLRSPLIVIKESIEDLSPDKRLDMDFMSIEFGRIFFYQIYERYAVIKAELFTLWGKAGSGTTTELFDILLFDLLGKYGSKYSAAIKAKRERKRKEYRSDDAYYKAVAEAQRRALTYRETCVSIRERVSRDYESTGKQRADFKKDITAAIGALKKIGLIREASFTIAANGEEAIDFVFNMDYYKPDTGDTLLIVD